MWATSLGQLSPRKIATAVWNRFESAIGRLADLPSFSLARRVLTGRQESWLDQTDRPDAYEDVGRDQVEASESARSLGFSRYERVVLNTIVRRPLHLDGRVWIPEAVRGWSRVVLRRDDGVVRVFALDALAPYLSEWER
jgi:hypothetical protein